MPEHGLSRAVDLSPLPSSPRSEPNRPTHGGGILERVVRVLDLARTGKASTEDLAEASLALQMIQERLLDLFSFPAFPEEREGILRLGSWESLPKKQRAAYTEIKAMLSPRRK